MTSLRKKAEDLLFAGKNSIADLPVTEVKRMMQELQLYHIELEMQNEELQQTTTELGLQRIKFENLFELAPVGYMVLDSAALVREVNHSAVKLLGVDKSALLSKPFLLRVFEEDTDLFYVYFRQLLLSPKSLSCTIRMITAEKQILNVQLEGVALYSTAGNTQYYLTISDFTEKQQADLNLTKAKAQLEIALNASLTGIWEIDVLTGQVYLDEFCCKLYGYELLEFDRQYNSLLNRIHPNDRNNLELRIRQTIVSEKHLSIRFRAVLADLKINYIQARAQVVINEDGKKRLIGTFTDISEKMISELEAVRIQQENQQMILAAGLQAEENEKKRISEVLHDGIAQMLYAIKLNIDQVKRAPEQMDFNHISGLINQSIKDVRNISFELTPSILADFGLDATLEDMAGRLSNKGLYISSSVVNISKNQDFQLQLNIFRIIQELVNNAIKHASPDKISIEVFKKNKLITVTVADNGTGFKTDARAPKGIGLSSIKNRLRLYNGNLKIEPQSAAGGTIICATLKLNKITNSVT